MASAATAPPRNTAPTPSRRGQHRPEVELPGRHRCTVDVAGRYQHFSDFGNAAVGVYPSFSPFGINGGHYRAGLGYKF